MADGPDDSRERAGQLSADEVREDQHRPEGEQSEDDERQDVGRDVVQGPPEYGRSVVYSFVFSLGVTTLGLVGSLFLANLANQKIRGLPFYRTAILWTYGIAPPVSGIIWLFIFHPSYGMLPYLLSMVTTYEFNWSSRGGSRCCW